MIVAVIPCYNEEKTIADIVVRAKKYCHRVIVVDNGSSDKTSLAASESGAMVVQYREVQGAGATTSFGINTALVNKKHDIIVMIDGDGQHNPDEIPLLVNPIMDGEADLVIGSRFLGEYKIAKYRKFGIDIINWLYNIGRADKLTDTQSCFRAFIREIAEKVGVTENGFGFSTEFLIKARKFRIREVPISCIYHQDYHQNSTKNPITHGIEVAFATIKWRILDK